MAGDIYFDDVAFLLHFDGANGSTTFTDVKSHTVTANGNAQISTAQSKFGGASGLFDGTGDYLVITDPGDLLLSGNDWTIECWVRPGFTSAYKAIYTHVKSSPAYGVQFVANNTGKFTLFISTSGSAWAVQLDSTTSYTSNTWYHLAAVRIGNNVYLFVNGTLEDSDTLTGSIYNPSQNPAIASSFDGTVNGWIGHIDDFRLTIGTGRYSESFSVPTEAYPDIQEHVLTIADASHGHSADNLELVQNITLVIADAAHSHSADNQDLSQLSLLSVQGCAHGHTADNVDVMPSHLLVIQDATHGHVADDLGLLQVHILTIQESAHGHTADNQILTASTNLHIQDVAHGLSSGNIDLWQHHILVIDNTLHAHLAEQCGVFQEQIVTPPERTMFILGHAKTVLMTAEQRDILARLGDRDAMITTKDRTVLSH
jgi:hypothetical protein